MITFNHFSPLFLKQMDVLSMRLRPIQPSHAARAIGRFLVQQGCGEDHVDGLLSADVVEQLKGMKAALQVKGKAKKSRTRFLGGASGVGSGGGGVSSNSSSSSSGAAAASAAGEDSEAVSSSKRRRV